MFNAGSIECPKPAKTVGTAGLGPDGPFFWEKMTLNHFLVRLRYFLCSLSKQIKKRRMREAGVWNGQL